MSSDTVRGYVADVLTPLVPAEWKIDPGIPSSMHTLGRPLMWLEYTGLEPLAEAPSKLAATVDVCIATNKTDVRKGEADADEAIFNLFAAAFAEDKFYGMRATKAAYWDAYFGWRLTITVITSPKE